MIEGGLQGIGNGHALGWCWRPGTPDERVAVAIVVDGEIAAEGIADLARPDLAELGDGAHGFLIALPDALRAPGRHSVQALAGEHREPVPTTPTFWCEAASDNGWGDVAFEPARNVTGAALTAKVPAAPAPQRLRAVSFMDWLFDASEFEASPEPAPADLDAIVADLSATAATCATLGITYLPAIIPAKRRVVRLTPPLDRRWIAELKARIRDVDELELLDLLQVLRHADRHGATYHRTDPDWNDRGAFFVARALLKEAHKWVPTLKPPALADLHVLPLAGYLGSLADAPKCEFSDGEVIERELEVEAEDGVVIDAHELHALRMPVESHLAAAASTHLRVYANTACSEDAHIAVVGDAAALPVVTWLAERTRRTTFFWSDALPLTLLELDLPQVVIHLMREADLLNLCLGEPISSAQTAATSRSALQRSTLRS